MGCGPTSADGLADDPDGLAGAWSGTLNRQDGNTWTLSFTLERVDGVETFAGWGDGELRVADEWGLKQLREYELDVELRLESSREVRLTAAIGQCRFSTLDQEGQWSDCSHLDDLSTADFGTLWSDGDTIACEDGYQGILSRG